MGGNEVERFLDIFDPIGDLPMIEDRIFPVCRVCGHKIRKRAAIIGGPYCPHCKKKPHLAAASVVAVISY